MYAIFSMQKKTGFEIYWNFKFFLLVKTFFLTLKVIIRPIFRSHFICNKSVFILSQKNMLGDIFFQNLKYKNPHQVYLNNLN